MTTPGEASNFRRRPLGPYRYTRRRWHLLFLVIDTLGAVVFGLGRILYRIFERFSVRCSSHRVAPIALLSGRRSRKRRLLSGGSLLCLRHPDSRAIGATRLTQSDPQRILLVQLDHLGDAILTTAILAPLRRRYSQARIDVLASPWNEAIFRACPEIDTVHVFAQNRFARQGRRGWLWATLGWGLRLRRYRYDLAIDVRGEFPLAVLLWLSGAPRRLGWACGGGRFLLTNSPAYVPDRPEIDSRAALLAELGIARTPAEPAWYPRVAVGAAERAEGERRWTTLAGAPPRSGPRVVFHVGAGTAAKQWPAEHWRELLGRTIAEFDAQVVLVGSPADRIIASRILGAEAWPRVVDATGQLSIAELAGVLHQADLLVGADSGPAHLAAAVGTPVVSLFSGTNCAHQWQPRGQQVTVVRQPVACSPCHREECPQAEHPCMRGLEPARVAEAMRGVLVARREQAVREDQERTSSWSHGSDQASSHGHASVAMPPILNPSS